MIVRLHIEPNPLRFPAPSGLLEIYGKIRPLQPGTPLFMEPTQLSVPLAESIAIAELSNTRAAFGGSYQILPEAQAPVAALRGRSSFLIGSGTNSQAARILLQGLPWCVE